LVLQKVDKKLITWIEKKYKIGYRKAYWKLKEMRKQTPKMFYHWEVKCG